MTLTELKYLVNLDKERHFGRAAARSFVSQPTLSIALKKLEDQLGMQLFERHRGEARPTPLGARIVAQARVVLAEAAKVEDIAREGGDELSGALRIGAIYTVGPYLLPPLVPHLRKRAPQMPLVIEENFTSVLLEQLRQNDLDVIVAALPLRGDGVEAWALYDEPFMALLPAGHRWAKLASIEPKRLAEEPLLLLGPGHCFREQVIEACPKCLDSDPDAPRPHTGSSLETIRHMVVGGLGITVVPRSSVENRPDEPKMLVARPLQKPAPHRRIALAWRKSFPRRKAIVALHDAILECGMKGVDFLPDAKPEA